MIVRLDPISIGFVVLSIILSWGWTELTTEPICKKQIERGGELYTVTVDCSSIPI